jgi:hypothetical protein
MIFALGHCMDRLLVLILLLCAVQASAAPTAKSAAAHKRQIRAIERQGSGRVDFDALNLNGKDVVRLTKTAGGTTREVTVSRDGQRVELETTARNGQTYYHGFEDNAELVQHGFNVGKRSALRKLGFRPGEEVEVQERRLDGKTTSKVARAIREDGASVHERSLMAEPAPGTDK